MKRPLQKQDVDVVCIFFSPVWLQSCEEFTILKQIINFLHLIIESSTLHFNNIPSSRLPSELMVWAEQYEKGIKPGCLEVVQY